MPLTVVRGHNKIQLQTCLTSVFGPHTSGRNVSLSRRVHVLPGESVHCKNLYVNGSVHQRNNGAWASLLRRFIRIQTYSEPTGSVKV